MTIDQVRSAYNSQPFRPFVMHPAPGRSVPVSHREFFMAPPGGRTLTVCQPDDTVNIIDLARVTDLEITPRRRARGKRKGK